jgi:hypothetical protein
LSPQCGDQTETRTDNPAERVPPAAPAGFDVGCRSETFLLFSAKYLVANVEERFDATID